MLLLLTCVFEVQFFVEKYALFLVGAGISCSFFFKGVWVSESKSNFLLGMPGMPSFGDPKFGDPYFPSKKRSPLPSLTAKLLLPWS